ncbi:MAG: hypothetical protein ACK5KN_16590 [Dysgonomonas sp.]|uniref:hypothetical protein n=1 Tax=Dysgonomonas sp. TaxID=1891233 RepID=UPI003A857700
MLQFNFKDKYYSASGSEIIRYFDNVYFFSPSYVGGNGSRLAPYRSNSYSSPTNINTSALIFSGGFHKGNLTLNGNSSTYRHLTGNGMGVTTIDLSISQSGPTGAGTVMNAYYRDLTISKLSHNLSGYPYTGHYFYFNNCEFLDNPYLPTNNTSGSKAYITRCKLKYPVTLNPIEVIYQNNNSFIGIDTTIGSIAGALHTFEKCNLIVNQASLDSYKNNYYAFDNCNFRIGTELDYAPLIGTTTEELRSNFVARCTAAGLTVPADITDYGITLPLGRWIFTKNQIFEGITWKGSEIYQFETLRFISFGYSGRRGDKIPVTTDNNIPLSFAPNNPHSDGLVFAPDSLSVSNSVDITKRENMYADSKIIWLGGKKKLTKIDIPNDLPYLYGVLIDSIPNLLCDPGQEVTQIESGDIYMVRSSDENAASVTYNGSTYSSILSTRNNIFKGVAGVASFVIASGRAVVYKINDILNYQSIQLRIVNKIPSELKKTGNLTPNYWYLVEHDSDQNNTTDYVTYNGVNYKVGDSFVCQTGSLTFTTTGNIHLRRCWDKDFNFDTEVTDKAFWQNEQKPEWCVVLPEDTRCLMYNYHPLSIEMMRGEDGKYITTGHPEYYNRILGASGIQSPDDIYIQGTYMQLRLPITTANPM